MYTIGLTLQLTKALCFQHRKLIKRMHTMSSLCTSKKLTAFLSPLSPYFFFKKNMTTFFV